MKTSEPIDCAITVNQNGITFVDDKNLLDNATIYAVDGKIVRLNSYKRGKPSGVHKAWYHPTGILAYEGSRKNGEIHGKYVGYHENGSYTSRRKLKKGFYAENGNITTIKVN